MRTYPIVLLIALGISFLIVVTAGSGSSTVGGRVGGDFPAFYGAGSLVADGHVGDLYSPSQQAAQQVELLGSESGFLAFAYPPHVALAYSPLSTLPYRLAYVIHTAFMFVALVAALHMMRAMVGLIDRYFALSVAAAISFYPMFMAVGGGQNTALTLLLITWLWRSLDEDRERAAGVAVALLMFRPQYAIPLMGLLFLGRHFVAVRWAALGGAATWLLNAVVAGPDWVADWLSHAGPFVSADASVNAHNANSIIGFLRATIGHESVVAMGVGAALAALVAVVVAHRWWSRNCDLDLLMALTSTGLVLMSPHAMFYDTGLTVLTLAVLVGRDERRWTLVLAVAAAAMTQTVSGSLDFSPFAPIVMLLFVLTARDIPADRMAPARLRLEVH